MAIATSLYCATQLHSKTFPRLLFPGACVTRKTLPCHKPTLKSSLLPPVAVAASSSSVQAEPRTTAGEGFTSSRWPRLRSPRLEPGYPLIIGCVNIPHDRGCEAHSDGDVLLHCVVDVMFGASGLPDIGQISPTPILTGKGQHLLFSLRRLPQVSPHKEAVRANLCHLLGSDPSVINLKAKTHEKVDSLGENRSIAAHTVVLLMRN